jgi:hypothetical protein
MTERCECGAHDGVIETLIEAQALITSSIYVELVNLGLIESKAAALRLKTLGKLAASPVHRHPEIAAALGDRIISYAEGFERAHEAGERPQVKLQLIDAGRT